MHWGRTLALRCAVSAAEADEVTLGSAAAESGRYLGAALDPDAFDERLYRDLAAAQLTSVTPENAMKWQSVEPLRGAFHWRSVDALIAFAKAHGQKVRGHARLPFATAVLADPRPILTARASRPYGRPYRDRSRPLPGAVYAWDVVNEPSADDGGWRRSIWYEAIGPGYVAIALTAVRAADLDAKLHIHD
jgi:endo-1,4-beta-xylanase